MSNKKRLIVHVNKKELQKTEKENTPSIKKKECSHQFSPVLFQIGKDLPDVFAGQRCSKCSKITHIATVYTRTERGEQAKGPYRKLTPAEARIRFPDHPFLRI